MAVIRPFSRRGAANFLRKEKGGCGQDTYEQATGQSPPHPYYPAQLECQVPYFTPQVETEQEDDQLMAPQLGVPYFPALGGRHGCQQWPPGPNLQDSLYLRSKITPAAWPYATTQGRSQVNRVGLALQRCGRDGLSSVREMEPKAGVSAHMKIPNSKAVESQCREKGKMRIHQVEHMVDDSLRHRARLLQIGPYAKMQAAMGETRWEPFAPESLRQLTGVSQ